MGSINEYALDFEGFLSRFWGHEQNHVPDMWPMTVRLRRSRRLGVPPLMENTIQDRRRRSQLGAKRMQGKCVEDELLSLLAWMAEAPPRLSIISQKMPKSGNTWANRTQSQVRLSFAEMPPSLYKIQPTKKINISVIYRTHLLFNFVAHPLIAMRQMLSYWLSSSNISIVWQSWNNYQSYW